VPPALAALRASLAEQLARVRDGAAVPDALLDVALQRFALTGPAPAEEDAILPPSPADAGTPGGRAATAQRPTAARGAAAGDGNGTVAAGRREARPAGGPPRDDDLVVVRPRDWSGLREAEAAAGRPTPYWAVPWPSGHVLAQAVAARGGLGGARVLELGCGLALPSVAAARAGADVLATDVSPDATVFAAHDLALNDVTGATAAVDWRDDGALAAQGPFDLVLAADVLYTRENVESLLRVLPELLAGGGEAWVADPGRTGASTFLPFARRTLRLLACERGPDATVHRLTRRDG